MKEEPKEIEIEEKSVGSEALEVQAPKIQNYRDVWISKS